MLDIKTIIKTKSYKSIRENKTQIDYYIENKSNPDIVKLVGLNNKSFGEKMQRIVMESLNLDKPDGSSHDMRENINNVKFETKSSRFWVKVEDWNWQHIMENHDYDYLLLCGLNFQGIDVFIISKNKLINLKDNGLVKQQGGGEGQGLWCRYKNIKEYLTPINSKEDIIKYIS
jgi:hypothetical protein